MEIVWKVELFSLTRMYALVADGKERPQRQPHKHDWELYAMITKITGVARITSQWLRVFLLRYTRQVALKVINLAIHEK